MDGELDDAEILAAVRRYERYRFRTEENSPEDPTL